MLVLGHRREGLLGKMMSNVLFDLDMMLLLRNHFFVDDGGELVY